MKKGGKKYYLLLDNDRNPNLPPKNVTICLQKIRFRYRFTYSTKQFGVNSFFKTFTVMKCCFSDLNLIRLKDLVDPDTSKN